MPVGVAVVAAAALESKFKSVFLRFFFFFFSWVQPQPICVVRLFAPPSFLTRIVTHPHLALVPLRFASFSILGELSWSVRVCVCDKNRQWEMECDKKNVMHKMKMSCHKRKVEVRNETNECLQSNSKLLFTEIIQFRTMMIQNFFSFSLTRHTFAPIRLAYPSTSSYKHFTYSFG